jgi:hypothetical protein
MFKFIVHLTLAAAAQVTKRIQVCQLRHNRNNCLRMQRCSECGSKTHKSATSFAYPEHNPTSLECHAVREFAVTVHSGAWAQLLQFLAPVSRPRAILLRRLPLQRRLQQADQSETYRDQVRFVALSSLTYAAASISKVLRRFPAATGITSNEM